MQHLRGLARQKGESGIGNSCNEFHLCLPHITISPRQGAGAGGLPQQNQKVKICVVAMDFVLVYGLHCSLTFLGQSILHSCHCVNAQAQKYHQGRCLGWESWPNLGKESVLRKYDQKFNKWSHSQTWMLIQKWRDEARMQGCSPFFWPLLLCISIIHFHVYHPQCSVNSSRSGACQIPLSPSILPGTWQQPCKLLHK